MKKSCFFMFYWIEWNDNLLCSSPLDIQNSEHCVSIIMLFPFEIFFSIHKFLFSSLMFSPVKQKRKPKNAIKISSFFSSNDIIDEKLQRQKKKHFQFFLWLCHCFFMLPMLSHPPALYILNVWLSKKNRCCFFGYERKFGITKNLINN